LAKIHARNNPDAIYDTRIYRTLRRTIELALRWRRSVVALTVATFLAAIGGFGFVQQQFFPTSTRTELFLEMRLPEGTAIGVTDATAKKAERLLAGDPDIATYTTYVGQGSPRFWLGLNPVLPNFEFCADRHRHEGPGRARARQSAARSGARGRCAAGGAHPG
jgi:multidrug efflux pump